MFLYILGKSDKTRLGVNRAQITYIDNCHPNMLKWGQAPPDACHAGCQRPSGGMD